MKLTRTGRVRVATAVWLAVGVMLIVRGFFPYFFNIESTGVRALTLVLALVIGVAKGIFVIAKSAERTAGYIRRRPHHDWVWFSFHPVLYLVIPLMIGMGIALRVYAGPTMPWLVLGVYVGIGAAMIAGTRGFKAAVAEVEEVKVAEAEG